MEKTPGRVGRPRSEQAREAVLHAVDDLLLEVGYPAMTMKGIAERAAVGRQTVYRWWSTKAEILFEASVIDAEQELAVVATGNAEADATTFVHALVRFLTDSPAGAAYRALWGEAQHDPAVAALVLGHDVVTDSARRLLADLGVRTADLDRATALLVGPAYFWIMTGRSADELDVRALVTRLGEYLPKPRKPSAPRARPTTR